MVQAIKSIAHDHLKNKATGITPSYTFEDWECFFYLLGIINVSNTQNALATSISAHNSGTTQTGIQAWRSGEETLDLDWLHVKNPLNLNETLTEWIIMTLVEKLASELGDLRRRMGNTSVIMWRRVGRWWSTDLEYLRYVRKCNIKNALSQNPIATLVTG